MSRKPPAMKATARTEVRVLDLFSGAGGLSEGLSQASNRYRSVAAVEHDLAAAATFAANHPTAEVYAGAIEDWVQEGGITPADVVVGGPPCQGFSSLGKQDANDARNHLWEWYAETIRRAKPKLFIMENVPAFLRSPQLERFRELCSEGGALSDYSFEAEVLNAADYGSAQTRRRVILVGHHRDLAFPGMPVASHKRESWVPIKEVLAGLPEAVTRTDLPQRWTEFAGRTFAGSFKSSELHLTRHYEQISLDRFACIKEGGNRFDIPHELLAPCWRKHLTGSGDVMGRLRWDSPSVTIRTEFFKPEKGRYLHPTEPRAITHFEAARIQGFPDDYLWVGSKTAIAKQIGNAVPIPLGKAIGEHLLAFL